MKTVKKLKLNKEVVAQLNDEELQNVQGGFTYGLSMGYICKDSKAMEAQHCNNCNSANIRESCKKGIYS